MERFNICFGNNNIHYKYCLTSSFPSKMKHNEKSLPNKATLISKMHLIFSRLLACMRALRLKWALSCTLLVAESIRNLPLLILSCFLQMQYSYWDILSHVVVPIEPWQGAHILKLSGLFSSYQNTWWMCLN